MVKHAVFRGRLVMLGFGSIGQGVLPLILRHIEMPRDRIQIIAADNRGAQVAAAHGVRFTCLPITRDNYRDVLGCELGRGDFLLNLSVDVSSVALVALCRELGALYLDTCVEPWAGGYTDPSLSASARSNYALRESALALARPGKGDPTAVMTHGANPGLVSHFVKQALLNIAAETGRPVATPATREGWAALAHDLGVKVIHIAERDTQTADVAKTPGEFVNTWSIDGFVGEGNQPAELGWGTHEKTLPADGHHHEFGCDAAIYLNRRGAATRATAPSRPQAAPICGARCGRATTPRRDRGRVIRVPPVANVRPEALPLPSAPREARRGRRRAAMERRRGDWRRRRHRRAKATSRQRL